MSCLKSAWSLFFTYSFGAFVELLALSKRWCFPGSFTFPFSCFVCMPFFSGTRVRVRLIGAPSRSVNVAPSWSLCFRYLKNWPRHFEQDAVWAFGSGHMRHHPTNSSLKCSYLRKTYVDYVHGQPMGPIPLTRRSWYIFPTWKPERSWKQPGATCNFLEKRLAPDSVFAREMVAVWEFSLERQKKFAV